MRRLAAILAADLVGYTRLMSADEAGTLARLKALREDVLEPIVADHQGRVVKLIGDGLLVEFTSAVEAVACATEWQEHVVEQEAARDPNARLQFRIGLNIGDVIAEGDDLYGEGVNIAARMEGLAEPGGICLSAKVHQEVVNKLPLAFEDLGAKKLKNVSEPVRVYRISPGSHDDQGIRQADSGLARSDKPSIAVLPFTNMSDDPEQSYFSDGITEDIITELSRFHTLFVIARNSTFAYKGQAVKVQDVGRDLGVAYVVEGSVRKSGARVRVTSQLVETASGNHVWADRYDRSIDEIFAVQDELVQRIVTTLVRRVEDVTRETIARKLPENMAAYDYVLRGYPHVFRAASPGDTARAREFLEKALVADPSYGRAQAVLALSHLVDVFMFWATDPAASMKLAYETAQKAVRLDNSDNVTHWVLGEVLLFGKEFDQATMHIERALALNPNDADVRAISCFLHTCLGDAIEGIAYGRSAMERNPYYPDWYPWMLSAAYYDAGEYEKALETLAVVSAPNVNMRRIKAMALAQLDRLEEAKREVSEVLRLQPAFSIGQQLKMLPLKQQSTRDHFAEGMRKAGFPE